MFEHLAHEERVAAGDPVQPCGVDGALADQPLDRVDAERRQRQRAGARGSRGIAEQHAQRVADTDLVVADDADGERARLRDASQHEPKEVDGALVGPLQIVENEHRRRGAQIVVDGVENVVGRIAFGQHRLGGGCEPVRDVVNRAERSRRRQRVARAPQHALVFHPAVDERLDERRLARAGLPRHEDQAAAPCPRVVGPGDDLAELMIPIGEHHEARW